AGLGTHGAAGGDLRNAGLHAGADEPRRAAGGDRLGAGRGASRTRTGHRGPQGHGAGPVAVDSGQRAAGHPLGLPLPHPPHADRGPRHPHLARGHQPRSRSGGALTVGRQPAEGRAGEMAGHLAAGGAARRADPRHRRRGEDRGLSTHPEARRRRCGHRARLQRTPRGPGHVRSAPRHVRRPDRRAAAAQREGGSGARTRDRDRGAGGGGAMRQRLRRCGHRAPLQRPPRGPGHVRSAPRHVRRPDRRAAAAECERGRGARPRDRNRGPGGGGAMRQRLRRLDTTALVYIALVLVLIVGAVLVATTGRSFFSAGNIRDILTGMSVLGFVAIGQTLVILGASLDLSVPYVMSLASLIAAQTMDGSDGMVLPAVLLTLAVTAAIGAANGVFVTVLKVHGFVATLGMGLMLKGYLDTNYQGTEGSVPSSFQLFDATGIGPVPISTLFLLALDGPRACVIARTSFAHRLCAVGGNAELARLSAVRERLPLIGAHIGSSVCAGLAGLLLASRLGVGSPTVGSQGSYDLLSIAAVVLGGTVLMGGRGTIWG